MYTIGVDPAIGGTGIAVVQSSDVHRVVAHDTLRGRVGLIAARVRGRITKLCESYPGALLAIERPVPRSRRRGLQDPWGPGLVGGVAVAAWQTAQGHTRDPVLVGVADWRRAMVGREGASKSLCVLAANAWIPGDGVASDDEAEAILIAVYAAVASRRHEKK